MKRSFTLLVRPGLTGKHKMYKDTLKKERETTVVLIALLNTKNWMAS